MATDSSGYGQGTEALWVNEITQALHKETKYDNLRSHDCCHIDKQNVCLAFGD